MLTYADVCYRPFLWPLLCGVEKARSVKGEHVFPSLLQRSEGAERNAELALDLGVVKQ